MSSLVRRLAHWRGRGSDAAAAPRRAPQATGGEPWRPTFVLGLGCQKGGTTWLHDYLAQSPQFIEGYRKEFHIFDALDVRMGPEEEWRGDQEILRKAQRQVERALAGEPFQAKNLHWASMLGNLDFYFDYFATLLARRARVRATGDFTPTYGQLSAERVAQIQSRFERRGIRTVGVFTMRDPVDRIWSQARMLLGRHDPDVVERSPEQAVADLHATPRYESRTRYDHTLRVIDEVFAPEDQWVGFYEEMFDEEQIRAVCDVIGIDFRPPDLGNRSNASPRSEATLPDETVRKVAQHYRGVYEAVAERFPEKDLTQLWPSSRHVL